MTLTEQAIATIAAGCEGVTIVPRQLLEDAADLLRTADAGDQSSETGWASDEMAHCWLRLMEAAKGETALCALAQEALQSRREGQQMREATDTETALSELERAVPGAFWMMSKGRISEREPLYGFSILFGTNTVLADGEGDTPERAVRAAIRALSHPKPESVK